ncbi:IMG2 [[Candida] subhashii]|uniref:Large ribosomal subunit protein mL49 n=1 Tax=[Candida] subhashii TaxID=561895 RepID=A0A8J5Q5S7_9ASCO|nr:IMG2 [[Candida] subhashii]KAG7661934.1 IMG2 [[Candida] subhashii]
MRVSQRLLITVKRADVRIIPKQPIYEIPSLSSITYKDLPDPKFGNKTYHVPMTKFKHWPVYPKIQGSRRQTEIKRVQGDVVQLSKDLLKLNPNLIIAKVNTTAGYINIKGDVTEEIKQYFNRELK